MEHKIRVGITIGDINGIGPEIILKACLDNRLSSICTPIVYGSSKVFGYYRKALNIEDFSFQILRNAAEANPKKANLVNCWEEEVKIDIGEANENGGKYAYKALECAVEDLKKGDIDVLVTAPINKQSMKLSGFTHPGHTEYLEKAFEGSSVTMLMSSSNMNIAVLTGHVPVANIAKFITKENVLKKLKELQATFKQDFSKVRPRIAVLGLNPHAGDNGAIGHEDEQISQAISEAKNNDIIAVGPFAADGFFGQHLYKQFDVVLAMYHDQGLIPFKSLSYGDGVNFTAGLPIIRTSPAHGTAMDIAGKNVADEQMLREAIYKAIDLHKTRTENAELSSNILPFSKMQRERGMA